MEGSMKEANINVKELEAVRLGCAVLLPDIQSTHILVESDNVTTVAYINKMGGVKSPPCRRRAKLIWQWILDRNCWITAQHLSGKENVTADGLSRDLSDGMEWQLDPLVFQQICHVFNVIPQVDLFASKLNAQLPNYMSYQADDDAIAIDAFCHSWSYYSCIYAFPPFSIIARMLQKMVVDKAAGLVIVPDWPTAPWFAALMRTVVGKPYRIPRSVKLLRLVHDRTRRHAMAATLQLLAVMVQH